MSDNHPTASGVSEEMVEAALKARVPGGSEVWVWLAQKDAFTPSETARDVIRCALEAALSAKPAQRGAHLEDILRDAMIGEPFLHNGKWCVTVDDALAGMTAVMPPQPIPTPDEALREILADVCKGSEYEAPLRGSGKLFFWQELALAAMSRVAALSRARPEALEEAAKVVEENQEAVSQGLDNQRYLTPRRLGDLLGVAFADGIRALKSKSAHSPAPRVDEATMREMLCAELRKVGFGPGWCEYIVSEEWAGRPDNKDDDSDRRFAEAALAFGRALLERK